MDETIIESRQELMVSPSSGGKETLRTAHFLKPFIKQSQQQVPHFPIFSQTTTTKLPLQVTYNGWRPPHEEWRKWVRKLEPKFESLWIKAGIYHAIKASTYEIKRDDDLILELANRWCSKTNTFIFSWGEATITLEDTKVCFGYSVLGCSVSTPLLNSEQKKAEEELIEARRMFNSSKARKVTQRPWMMFFMENESKVEHEAFLVFWLSRFVFPNDSFETISKSVFPIAIHLAHGDKIALAPAVLASVYRDLSLLSGIINKNVKSLKNLRVTLWAPFQLVQIWAFERFPSLMQSRPYSKGHALPKVARWGEVKMMKDINLKKVLDCAGLKNGFLWQPYENSPCIEVYNGKDKWRCDNPCLDEELLSFVRCLRVCELVGMGSCKEKYFPHRVAMQFGMDQDIPDMVDFCETDPWLSYSKPMAKVDIKLCILLENFLQLRSSTPGVSSRYYDWWKQSKSGEEGEDLIKCEESYGPTPGFSSKFDRRQMMDSDKEDDLLVYELSSCGDDELEVVGNRKASSSHQFGDFISTNSGDEIAGCNDENEIKSSFCDRNSVNDTKEEGVSSFTLDMALDLENKIQKLEKVFGKLKEERFGSRVESV